jgi:hypothetical protein
MRTQTPAIAITASAVSSVRGFIVPQGAGLGAGGLASAATITDWNPHVLCTLSQNGLFADWPQRHSDTRVRPSSAIGWPLPSTSSKSPSTRIEPLLLNVIRVAATTVLPWNEMRDMGLRPGI